MMLKTQWKTPVFFVLAVIIVCLVSNIAGRVKGRRIGREEGFREGYAAGWDAPHPADTIFRVDTIREAVPYPVEVAPAGKELLPIGTLAQMQARLDSLLAIKPDTSIVEVPVQIERKTYETPDYRAVVQGWRPELVDMAVFQKQQTITQYVVKEAPRWSFGVTAGPSFLWNGKEVTGGVGITAGLTLRIGK